jgi:hypothetical protein
VKNFESSSNQNSENDNKSYNFDPVINLILRALVELRIILKYFFENPQRNERALQHGQKKDVEAAKNFLGQFVSEPAEIFTKPEDSK